MNTVAAPTRDPMYLPQPEPVDAVEQRLLDIDAYSDWLCAHTRRQHQAFVHSEWTDAQYLIQRDHTLVAKYSTRDLAGLLNVATNGSVLIVTRNELVERFLSGEVEA